MINDINKIAQTVCDFCTDEKLKSIKKSDIDLFYSYYIDQNKVDALLKNIFDTCSLNEYCFSIFRDKYAQIKVMVFDKYDGQNLEILLFTQMPNEIISSDENKYNKKVNFLRKLKIIPVIGPDGVGKTTLLAQVMDKINEKIFYKRFKKIVRRSIVYNILQPINKYFLTKKFGKKPEKDQHDDIHYFLVICAGLGYYPYLFYKSLVKNNLIILDRFFYDYLLKNISFMEKETYLRENWKSLLQFIPKSYWIMHLDANSEVILSRKEELSSDDIDKYRELNFTLYLNKPSVVYTYINTGLDLGQCKNIVLSTGTSAKVFNKHNFSARTIKGLYND